MFYTGCLYNTSVLQVKESQRANDSTASQIEYARQRDSAKDIDEIGKNQDNQKLINAQIYSLQFSDSVSSESFKLARDAYNESVKQNNLKFDIDNKALQNQIEILKTQQKNFSKQNESILEIVFKDVKINDFKKTIQANVSIFNYKENPAKITFASQVACFDVETSNCESMVVSDSSDQWINRYVSFGKETKLTTEWDFKNGEFALSSIKSGTPFYISGTIKYKDLINIELIEGGPVAIGRNNGAKLVKTKYTLFLDADTVIKDNELFNDTIFQMYHYKLDLLTCKIRSYGKDIRTNLMFMLFNPINYFISKKTPFAVGMYFLTKTSVFNELGGFDETLKHSEDYWLSKQYNPKKFRITGHYIGQDDRRFKKMGYFGMIKLLLKGYFNKNNKEFYQKDVNYWD